MIRISDALPPALPHTARSRLLQVVIRPRPSVSAGGSWRSISIPLATPVITATSLVEIYGTFLSFVITTIAEADGVLADHWERMVS